MMWLEWAGVGRDSEDVEEGNVMTRDDRTFCRRLVENNKKQTTSYAGDNASRITRLLRQGILSSGQAFTNLGIKYENPQGEVYYPLTLEGETELKKNLYKRLRESWLGIVIRDAGALLAIIFTAYQLFKLLRLA